MQAQAFSILDTMFFQPGLNGSGLGLAIFHEMSPITHHNYL